MEKRSAAALLAHLRLTPPVLQGIGAVAAISATMEFWAERAVWTLHNISPAGTRPSTDTKDITSIIAMVRAGAVGVDEPLKQLIELWCEVAGTAVKCRNSIVHGLPHVPYAGGVVFGANLRWDNVERRRPYSHFHADERTLKMLSDALTVLVHVANYLAQRPPSANPDAIVTEMTRALKAMLLIVDELVDLTAAVNHDKY
ncbi:MAG: hypothetical protein E5Y06_23325 [Mesorhizobium sp.]|uniref:hypothetical protein n=1 Tax=Mesorhizobium sp. TaxID=1871066 RepID=UPI00122784C5|nr:hypothetical protein [Mesorhizobium sp.]TIN92446.1 MAG: hypothetical protein E5Y06_23325 [Mesorhizobium sp.]TJU97831.1 MAG: hypothetical protein E5Y08_15610 [Mesorhizobium sp.]